ncbi:MAG: NUDIX hydrolase [Candidatus Vogelbacteria bacterium]|nr:NUDIX hydrolase [Candidatus Vogelbacteria bacterium]
MPKISQIDLLPKKTVGTACVIENDKGEILLIKPTMLDGWLVPGGPLRDFESPKNGCMRKVKEETGIDILPPRLIGVSHSLRRSDEGTRYESLHLIFHAGKLTGEQLEQLKLDEKSFEKWEWCAKKEAETSLSYPLNERIKRSLETDANNPVAYIEMVQE